MKGFKSRLLFISVLLSLSTHSFASDTVIIPGLETASQYHHKAISKFYIQTGKFNHLGDAKRYQKLLQAQTNYAVKLKKANGHYTVDVGPIRTAPDVRATAKQLMQKLHPGTVVKTIPVKHTPIAVAKKHVTPHEEILVQTKLIVSQRDNFKDAPIMKDQDPKQLVDGRPYFGAGVGDMFYRARNNNSLATGAGFPPDIYVTTNAPNQVYGFLAGGYTWMRPRNWLPNYSLGLRYMYVPATSVKGYIDQYSDPIFKNYNYSYDVQLLNILATLKLDLYRWHNLMPYLMAGAGVSSVFTSNYSEQATKGVTPRVSPGFGSNSANNFAYQAGVGLDYIATENLWLNIEYNYENFGTVYTGKGANYASLTGTNFDNEYLKNQLSATTVFLGFTYYPA